MTYLLSSPPKMYTLKNRLCQMMPYQHHGLTRRIGNDSQLCGSTELKVVIVTIAVRTKPWPLPPISPASCVSRITTWTWVLFV